MVFMFGVRVFSALCTALVLFSVVSVVKAQDAEIEKIVGEVSADSQKGAIFSYSYMMKISYERHKFGGRKFTRLYEAIIPSRFSLNRIYSHPFILVRDSEKPVSEDAIRNMRKMIAKQIEQAETEEERERRADEKPPEDGGYWTIGFSAGSEKIKVDVFQLLKNARLGNLQKKQIDGRTIVSLDFAPKTETVFEKPLSYLSKIEGRIWIDEADKRITRVEGFPVGKLTELKDKPETERRREMVFLFAQSKVAEGFWFPQTIRLNFDKHPEIFEEFEVEFTFTEYKKGSVEVQYNEDKN